MKGDYEINRRWSDQYTPEIARILEGVMRQRMRIIITPSDFRVDTKQATDLVSGVIGPKAFAARLRRPGVFWGRNFGSPTHWGLQLPLGHNSIREQKRNYQNSRKVLPTGFSMDTSMRAHDQTLVSARSRRVSSV